MAARYDVLIAGAGPVGLMLACELALRDISVLVLERQAEVTNVWKTMPLGMRGLNSSSMEAFDRRGMLDGLFPNAADRVKALDKMPHFKRGGHFAGIPIDGNMLELDRWKYRLPHHTLAPGGTSMEHVEGVLIKRAEQLKIPILRGNGFATIIQVDSRSVTVEATDGTEYHGSWLVGCDGAHSAVRKAAGFEFEGTAANLTAYSISADIENGERLKFGFQVTDNGMYIPLSPGALHILDFDGGAYQRIGQVPKEHLQEVLNRVTGLDDLILKKVKHAAVWTDRSKVATTYREGRVFLAGDACHIHPPFGAQGLNAGLGDSLNLSWKLATAIKKESSGEPTPDALLATYQQERQPVADDIIEYTRAQMVLLQPDPNGRAVRKMITALIGTPDGANFYLDKFWGLSQRYLPAEEDCPHDVVGRSSPNFEFEDGSHLSERLHAGRGLLLSLGFFHGLLDAVRDHKRVDVVSAKVKDARGIQALLIRPDGIVAWASDDETVSDTDSLRRALAKWFP